MRRRGRALAAITVGLTALAVAGCGRDDFENEPRPPVPAEISVEVEVDEVVVSPAAFGAGLANFTIANLSDQEAAVSIEGPTEDRSRDIPAGGVTTLKMELVPGEYDASVVGGDAEPVAFEVGPERPSAQDELLLP